MFHLSPVAKLTLFTVCALPKNGMALNIARTWVFNFFNYMVKMFIFTLALNSFKGGTDKGS